MKGIYGLSIVVAAAAAFVCAAPAHAGSWQLTTSLQYSDSPGTWGSGVYNNNPNTATYYNFSDVFDNGSQGKSGSFTVYGTIQWTGGGSQPSSVTLSESATASDDSLYTATATQTAADGLGDKSTTQVDYNPYANVVTTSTGSHQTVVPMSNGEVYHFTRTLSASAKGGAVNDCYVTYAIGIQ